MRSSIPPGERLALTIKFSATEETFSSLSFQFLRTTIGEIVMEVYIAIIDLLREDFLRTLNTAEGQNETAQLFHCRWNIPNNIGAVDGKRILIHKPEYSGSYYHDYKGNESIIALVVAGLDYECLYIDI